MNIWLAALAAVVIQPLFFLLLLAPDYLSSSQPLYGIQLALLGVVVVAAAAVLVLGVPVFLLLRRYRRDSWVSLATAGFVLGALPAIFSWPSHLEGFSAGQNWHGKYVETYVNGVPTVYAWLTYGEGVLNFAAHGLIGALAYYSVWRWRERPNHSFCGTPHGARQFKR